MTKRGIRDLSRPFDYQSDDFLAVLEEMEGAPPRAAATVAGAFVEDSLRWSMESYFTDGLTGDDLLGIFEREGAPLVPRMLEGLGLARGDGRYARMLKSLARVQVLILDDWGLTPLTAEQRRDLLEIIDDRHGRTSTIVTSQLPIENWHAHIGDPTIADAVLDRLVHSAHRLELKGESLRKLRAAKNVKLDEATAN
jgi:hypothetical protein